tara:strand:- start:120 stop:323 length:204 start_codon:yes stop_codon:yes gene_type:complete
MYLKTLSVLLILIPNLIFGMTIGESINMILKTEIEDILKLIFEILVNFVFICLVLYVGKILIDKSNF